MGIPGAASNTEPNSELIAQGEGSAQGPEGSGPMSSTTTRNYEIDRTVRHVKRQGGLLERLSVAVVINSPVKPTVNNNEGADGESVEVNDSDDNEKYSKEQLERFTELVKGAVGYDGQRGDIVTIVSTTFEQQQATPEIIVKWHENDQILGLIKNLSFAIVLICFLFFVIRPMLKTYAKESPTIQESMRQLGLENDVRFSEEELKLAASGKPDALKVLQEKLRPKNPNVSAEMLDTANTYDDKVSLIRLLVADDAKRVANVLKQMISTA
jgi:flagellar M-ring protein FliF